MDMFRDIFDVFFSTDGVRRLLEEKGPATSDRKRSLQELHHRYANEGPATPDLDLAETLVACGILEVALAMGTARLPDDRSDPSHARLRTAVDLIENMYNYPRLLASFAARLRDRSCVDLATNNRDHQIFKNLLELYLSAQGNSRAFKTVYSLAWPDSTSEPGAFPLDFPLDRETEKRWIAVDRGMQLAYAVDQLLRSVTDPITQSALFSIVAVPFYGTKRFDAEIAVHVWKSMARTAGVKPSDEAWRQFVRPVEKALIRLLSGHYFTAYRLKWSRRESAAARPEATRSHRIFHGFGAQEPDNNLVGAYLHNSESPVSTDNNLVASGKVLVR